MVIDGTRSVGLVGINSSPRLISNRGTFVIDRSGVIQFAEMKQPGKVRDQAPWTDALAACADTRPSINRALRS